MGERNLSLGQLEPLTHAAHGRLGCPRGSAAGGRLRGALVGRLVRGLGSLRVLRSLVGVLRIGLSLGLGGVSLQGVGRLGLGEVDLLAVRAERLVRALGLVDRALEALR